jgi:hypothetical protein
MPSRPVFDRKTQPEASTYDAVVVGAGIVGAACAKELADAGLRVALCEQSGYTGGGATAAGMGHLAVMDDSEAQFALTSYSQLLWRELAAELPAQAEYLACGALWVAADPEELDEARRKFQFYRARNIAAEILDAVQLAEAEPNLRTGLAGGLVMVDDNASAGTGYRRRGSVGDRGEIAGYGACRETARARRLFSKRDSARGFATALERAFALGRNCGRFPAPRRLFAGARTCGMRDCNAQRPPLLSARAGSLLLKEEGSITQ